ncbi:MAG: helix-turn-helix domain-containing protein [Acutalibacteraceae bacterium]
MPGNPGDQKRYKQTQQPPPNHLNMGNSYFTTGLFEKSTHIRVITPIFVVIILLTQKWVMIMARLIAVEYSELYVKRIRFLCQQRGITINKLATMSDVKQSTLDNIVRGLTKNPRVKTLHKIAIAFNMTLSEFLDFDELNAYSFEDDNDD